MKAIRAGRAQLKEAYVIVKNGEIMLIGAHITPLPTASTHVHADPTRTRKLLLHREEINRLVGQVERAGYTMVPLNLHYNKGRIKLDIGLAKGKKQYDKREAEKEREWKREQQRLLQGAGSRLALNRAAAENAAQRILNSRRAAEWSWRSANAGELARGRVIYFSPSSSASAPSALADRGRDVLDRLRAMAPPASPARRHRAWRDSRRASACRIADCFVALGLGDHGLAFAFGGGLDFHRSLIDSEGLMSWISTDLTVSPQSMASSAMLSLKRALILSREDSA